MALNPTFASASVNPSQSMGSDASAPAQGALPTGMPQNFGMSGLGGQANQPQYTSPLNQPSAPDVSENAYQRYAGQQTLAGGATQQYGDWANSQVYGGIPMNYQPSPPPWMTQGAMPPMEQPLGMSQLSSPYGGAGVNFNIPNGQPQPTPQVGNLGNDVEIPKLNYLGYKPGWQQEADNTWSYNTENFTSQNNNDWGENYLGYRGVPNDAYQKYQDALSRGEAGDFSGDVMNQYTATTKPRYTTDFSQLGLSQTALDQIKMNRQAPDLGQYYYDTKTGMFNQGAGHPGPNIPGQRRYTGMTNIPLDVMNRMGTGEQIDFSPYKQYTEGTPVIQPGPTPPPLAPQQQDFTNPSDFEGLTFAETDNFDNMPIFEYDQDATREDKLRSMAPYMTRENYTNNLNQLRRPAQSGFGSTGGVQQPVQQPQVGGLQDPQTNPFPNPLNDFKNTEQWQRVAPNYAGLPQNVQDYVASQLSQGAMDGGTNWQYNPTTQTFSGTPNGMTLGKPTPEVKSLAQMKDYVNWINSPNAGTTQPPASWERPPIIQGSLGDLKTAAQTGTNTMATNPLSTYATTPTTGSTPAPTLNATPGSASSGSFGQGGVLPNVTTTQQQVTAAPSFYTDYLNQLATQGGRAAQDAQYVGAQPLQEQAFNLASQNVGNYQPTLQNAINLASSVGNTNLAQAIGDVGQANIARNLSPQATAGIVGSGQFGSKRGAQALGDVIANAELGLTAQQQQAMQQDMANRIAAAQQLGTLANSTQQLGLGDVNALSTLGQQQQTIAQNQQLFPMQQLANQSALLRGYTIPTSVSASQTGPGQQGQFQTSPLQQIMSVGTLLGALAKPGADGTSAGGNLYGGLESLIKRLTGGTYTANPSTNTTTSTSVGDVSASMKTLPDGRPNPNYDAYADPNATDADRMAQNLLNSGNPGNVLFDDGSDVNNSNVYDYSNFDPDA